MNSKELNRKDSPTIAPPLAPQYGRIEIAKQALNFSIAHFTIFSSTERENLHGHNFQVECEVDARVGTDGLIFDYSIVKRMIRALCDKIDERVVLPEHSPHLTLEQEGDYLVAVFNHERLPFLHRDVMTLPIRNTTVEELSRFFLEKLLEQLSEEPLEEPAQVTIKVSSSPGQTGLATWKAS